MRLAYEKALKSAREDVKEGRLEAAEKGISEAMQLCSESSEGSQLRTEVLSRRRKSDALVAEAQRSIQSAMFDLASKSLREAQELWSTKSRATLEGDLSQTRKTYETALSEAKKLMKRHRYDEARAACDRALTACPLALEPSALQLKIWPEQEAYREKVRGRKKMARSGAKWGGLAIAGFVVLGGLGLGALVFWEWVQTTFWPLLMENHPYLVIVSLGVLVMTALIHHARYTNLYRWMFSNAWNMRSDSEFMAALTVAAVIAVIGGGLAYGLATVIGGIGGMSPNSEMTLFLLMTIVIQIPSFFHAMTSRCSWKRVG